IGRGVVPDPKAAARAPAPVPILQAMHGWSEESARKRVGEAYKEAQTRAIGTTLPFAAPDGAPNFVASRFAIGARASSVLHPPLPREEIVSGVKPEVPIPKGGVVSAQTEGSAISDTDPTTAMAS